MLDLITFNLLLHYFFYLYKKLILQYQTDLKKGKFSFLILLQFPIKILNFIFHDTNGTQSTAYLFETL